MTRGYFFGAGGLGTYLGRKFIGLVYTTHPNLVKQLTMPGLSNHKPVIVVLEHPVMHAICDDHDRLMYLHVHQTVISKSLKLCFVYIIFVTMSLM